MREVNWREIFQVQEVEKPYNGLPTEPGECNSNCQYAKEIKCTCKCGGKNHGAALKKHVKPLGDFSERDLRSETCEDPVDQTFNPEEYAMELAILA